MSSATGSEVKEGFLCPICYKDLGDVSQLQIHVSEAHKNVQDDRDVVFQIKGLFDKAKQRILNLDPGVSAWSENLSSYVSASSGGAPEYFDEDRSPEPQEPGVSQSHTDFFRKIRDERIDQVAVDTNKLIIRLDKLISDTPSDPSKRKAFEKNVIPWTSDSDVQFCHFCGTRFSLTRRKHHCRLCGKILCASCSQFLTFLAARKLVNPSGYDASAELLTRADSSQGSSSGSGGSPAKKAEKFLSAGLSATLSILKRDGSEVSLGSLLSQEGEDHLRICKECKELLNRRDEQIEQRSQPPHVVQMYDRLRSLMTEAGKVFPSYCRMAESLNSGESMYSLEAAKELRLKVMRLQEQIDFVSKKIMQFGMQPPGAVGTDQSARGKGPSPKQLLLQRNVRSFAGQFLQEMILSVPNLPSEEDYAKKQKEYKLRLKRQIEREREAAQLAAQRMISASDQESQEISTHPNPPSSGGAQRKKRERIDVTSALSVPSDGTEEGWTPDTSAIRPVFHYNPFDDDQPIDPLQQQIMIIKGYLKQAAESGRLEEVRMLEQNLKELEAELKEQNTLTSPR